MARRSNLASTRRTVRALRRTERLSDEAAAFVTLAETTAALLDGAVAGEDKAYSVALTARAHRDALAALFDHADPYGGNDAWDELLAKMTTPTPGTPEGAEGAPGSSQLR